MRCKRSILTDPVGSAETQSVETSYNSHSVFSVAFVLPEAHNQQVLEDFMLDARFSRSHAKEMQCVVDPLLVEVDSWLRTKGRTEYAL